MRRRRIWRRRSAGSWMRREKPYGTAIGKERRIWRRRRRYCRGNWRKGCKGAARGAQGTTEKRKRDGNTEFTEGRTQRTRRRTERERRRRGPFIGARRRRGPPVGMTQRHEDREAVQFCGAGCMMTVWASSTCV